MKKHDFGMNFSILGPKNKKSSSENPFRNLKSGSENPFQILKSSAENCDFGLQNRVELSVL